MGRALKKNALKVISQDAGQGFCSEMFLLFLLVLVLFPEFCCCATWRVNKVLKMTIVNGVLAQLQLFSLQDGTLPEDLSAEMVMDWRLFVAASVTVSMS